MKFKFEMPKGMFKEHSPILHLHVADGCSQYDNMKLNIFWLETWGQKSLKYLLSGLL